MQHKEQLYNSNLLVLKIKSMSHHICSLISRLCGDNILLYSTKLDNGKLWKDKVSTYQFIVSTHTPFDPLASHVPAHQPPCPPLVFCTRHSANVFH